MEKNKKHLAKILFLVLTSVLFMITISSGTLAVECGSTPTDSCEITQDTVFNTGTYYLPNGIDINANGITLDCNNSLLNGTYVNGDAGIRLTGDSNNIIKNCKTINYQTGILVQKNGPPPANYNLLTNNTVEDNENGIQLINAIGNNVTKNTAIENTRGIYLTSSASLSHIWNNNLINNSNQGVDNGATNNKWNMTFMGGNYWSDFDESSEGCANTDGDMFCNGSYSLSGSAGAEDFLPFFVESAWNKIVINEFIPIQVIEYVDFVKGKTTLVRVNVSLSEDSNSSSDTTATLYWNNTKVDSETQSISVGQSVNFDLWHVPDTAGNNIDVRVEVNGSFNGLTRARDLVRESVNVVDTRDLTLTFVAVDSPTHFQSTALDSIDFIDKVYPLADDGIISKLNYTNLESTALERIPLGLGLYRLSNRIHKSTLISGELPERAIGILPSGWFGDNIVGLENTLGISTGSDAVLVEEDLFDDFDHVSAHELGHTYGLCDEYDSDEWEDQDTSFLGFTSDLCPNGDSDDNDILDSECIFEGCPTSTLEPLSGRPDSTPLYNLMGSDETNNAWISKESYEHLLGEFNHSTPINVQSRAVVSGKINKTSGVIEFDNFYTIGEGLAENSTDNQDGNYSLDITDNSNNVLFTMNFSASFLNIFFNGSTIENNNSAFAFTVPFVENANGIVVKENGIIKDSRNLTSNTPEVSLISPSGNQVFSNENIEISWNASDLDLDDLSYAVLFSPDNGTTFNTLTFDYELESINVSSNGLVDSNQYLIKILVTDGINTNETIMTETFVVNNDLDVNDLSVIWQNNTERIFKFDINNTFVNQNITNISWILDTGETVLESNASLNITLSLLEEAFIYVYYNYTLTGNYTVIATAYNEQYSESEVIQVEVL